MRPKSGIYTPKRDDEHPHPFHMQSPPGYDYRLCVFLLVEIQTLDYHIISYLFGLLSWRVWQMAMRVRKLKLFFKGFL